MSKVKWLALLAAVMALGLTGGCGGGDDDGDGGGGGSADSYAGTWTGKVCGRDLVMVINQDGTSLSGTYTFSDPTFNGTFTGSVSSTTPPATAHLVCGSGHEDWWFQLTFSSYNQMSGGFCNKPETGVANCAVTATK